MRQPVYAPGTIVAGRYRIDKAIARGGCSIVYRGTHIEMGRSVALKIMSTGNGELDRAWTQRFQRGGAPGESASPPQHDHHL